MITKYLWFIFAIFIAGYVSVISFFVLQRYFFTDAHEPIPKIKNSLNQNDTRENIKKDEPKIISADIKTESVLLKVPFVPQAPLGNWENPILQNACEEASVYMAMLWVERKLTTLTEAEKVMIAMSNFEQKKYGFFLDTSAADTAQFMRDYFKYQNVFLKLNISVTDIKEELMRGNLIIVPVDGRALRNPFYTPPGPERHMLVIRGYNAEKKVFITNDPGTRRGEAYQYSEEILEGALRDYPSGYHEPISEVSKVMIVIGR